MEDLLSFWDVLMSDQESPGSRRFGVLPPPKVLGVLGEVLEVRRICQMSSVQNPSWLFDIGDYTTQLYGGLPINQSV